MIFQAAVKIAEYQARIEKLQQDMARQQLKHQLQIKVCFISPLSFQIIKLNLSC